jgi:peptide/nickel transport system substrate-binding protein
VLDAAGWKRGGDGIREKDGRKLRFVFQTSINSARQKAQQIVKQACQKAGMDIELKGVVAAVYFGADVANPDTNAKFWVDMQMYTQNMGPPDPGRFMDRYVSWEFATKANKWQGRNISRWRHEEYDQPLPRRRGRARSGETNRPLHPHERPAGRRQPCAAIGLSAAGGGANRNLVLSLSGWANDLTSVHSWYRDG